ncbi:MAG: type VI secretion system tip protein TssI/VgrG [Gemmataceae bacterium]
MPSYTQANQPLAIDTPLGTDKLLLTRVEGTEAISDLFRFHLDCLALAPVPFDDLLGKPATVRLTIPGCPQRYVNGILSSLEQGHQLQGPGGGATFYRYRAELVPRMWLCGLRQQSRVFQEVTVPDILRAVLHGDWGLPIRWRLTGTYPARDYCVQYRETDLDFVRRLMEEEGICFYFAHTEEGHTLVLADGPEGHDDLPGLSTLTFDAAAGGRRPEGRVTAWSKRQSLRPSKVTLRDHCFQLPDSTLQSSSTVPESVTAGQSAHRLKHSVVNGGDELLEYFDHLGGYAWRFDGVAPDGSNQPEKVQGLYKENQRVADLRAGAEATRALTIDGTSLCGHLLPGSKFTLQRHFDGDGGYLLTRVEHRADLESAYLSDKSAAGLLYENHFAATPAGLPFRPPLQTPRPRTYGVINAQVVGPKGGDIFVDKYGRVKVKFYWDREEATGPQNSCWLRVGQLWAGNRWGAFFWPRVGHEVVVSFIDGNPDRPLITGSVYNQTHMPPFELPANKTLAGIKSKTSSGGGKPADPLRNYSGWLINDESGQEHIELHGEKHIAFYAEETERHCVDGPHRLNVNGFHSVHVGCIPGGSGSGGGPSGGGGTGGTNGSGGGGGNGGNTGGTTNGGDNSGGNNTGSPNSGGGGFQEGRDPDRPYIINDDTLGKDFGVAMTTTCGINQGVNFGLYSTLTVGDSLTVTVNPLGLIADLGLAIPGVPILTGLLAGAAGPTLGSTSITMGSQVALAYGTSISISRGAKAAISESGRWAGGQMEAGEAPWAAASAAIIACSAVVATVGTIGGAITAYAQSQNVWLGLMEAAGALFIGMEAIEVYRAASNQVVKAKEVAEAALALSQDATAVEGIADIVTSIFSMDPLNYNTCKLIKGNTVEYNDSSRLIGADESVLIYSGDTSGEQAAFTLNNTQAGLFLGMPMSGPRMLFDSDEEEINIAVGPMNVGTTVTMTPGRLAASVGLPAEGSSIIMNEAGITLQSGPCKIILTVEGTITLETPAATLMLADGTLTAQADESVSILGAESVELLGESGELTFTDITIVGNTTML